MYTCVIKKSIVVITLMMVILHMLFALDSTPSQAEGPYYPQVSLFPNQSNTDWNLLVLDNNMSVYKGNGVRLMLTGKVLHKNGTPVEEAQVDIWQTDANGIYLHSKAPLQKEYDNTFQGYGSTITDEDGRYTFITIIPVVYKDQSTQRPPHIHVKVKDISQKRHKTLLITQIYLKDHPLNTQDALYKSANRTEDVLSIIPIDTQIKDALMGTTYVGKFATFDIIIR